MNMQECQERPEWSDGLNEEGLKNVCGGCEHNEICTKLEHLSYLEHMQWEKWSKHIAEELEDVLEFIKVRNPGRAMRIIKNRLERWEKNWVNYTKLDEETKDFDRVWAKKALRIMDSKIIGKYKKDKG